jgi:hypothetical protein
MTKEERTTIEPSDIKAIELECLNCHGRQTILLDSWVGNNEKCANCSTVWPMQYAVAYQSLRQLVSSISETAEIKGNKEIPFAIRLELKADAESKP